MALIKCKTCGHLISDKATRCPKCGAEQYPVTIDTELIKNEAKYDDKNRATVMSPIKKVRIAGVIILLLLIVVYACCFVDYNADFNYLALKFALSSVVLFGMGLWLLFRSKENNQFKVLKIFIVTSSMSLFCMAGFLFIRDRVIRCYEPTWDGITYDCMWWGESIWDYYVLPIIKILAIVLAVLTLVNSLIVYFSKSIRVAFILSSCILVGLSGISHYLYNNTYHSLLGEAYDRTLNRFQYQNNFKDNAKGVRFKSENASDKQGVIVRFSDDGSSVQIQIDGTVTPFVSYTILTANNSEGNQYLYIQTENFSVRFFSYNSSVAEFIPRYGRYSTGESIRLHIYPYVDSFGMKCKLDDKNNCL